MYCDALSRNLHQGIVLLPNFLQAVVFQLALNYVKSVECLFSGQLAGLSEMESLPELHLASPFLVGLYDD